jgi:branched-chain amino acid transport system permease protein
MIVWSRNPLMFPQILPMDPIAVTRGSEAHPPALVTVTVSSPSRWRSR